jgi:flagellar motility protein MotE (MotC chaperone)
MNDTHTAYREYILQVVDMIHDIGRLKRLFHLAVSLRRKEQAEPTRVDRKMEAITRADERRAACVRILDEVKDEKALERIYWFMNSILVR